MDDQYQNLLAFPGVVGFGDGFKEVGGLPTEKESIIVLVKQKVSPDKLLKHHLVPKKINGILTDVIEVGDIKAYSLLRPTVAVQSFTTRMRPAAPGVSIGHYLATAGTFGAVVYDKKSGQPLILSNNHILANSSNGRDLRAKIGDAILQPGSIDGGRSMNNRIAKLTKFVGLKEYPNRNNVDCALAKPLSNDLVVPEVIQIGLIRGIDTPIIGMKVKKSGRTSGLTTGQIRAINVTLNVSYGNGRTLKFVDQILTTGMSASGDSGSLVVTDENKAIGLLFAGSDQGTLLNPIRRVMDLLEVEF